jgi:hypothetical protein
MLPSYSTNANFSLSTPILQSFLVKSNLLINLENLTKFLAVAEPTLQSPSPIKKNSSKGTNKPSQKLNNKNITKDSYELPQTPELVYRSGSIIALKYKDIIKGSNDLFKTKSGFKNACHLVMCHTLEKRKKKLIHLKITAIGTFQVVGIPAVDVEKVIYKVFLFLEKLNKNYDIFKYITHDKECSDKESKHRTPKYRLELVIVPILKNYMVTLDQEQTDKIFQQNSKVNVVEKFIHNNFVSFILPNDPAITIKKLFFYKDFFNHPVKYITWNRKNGKKVQYIQYESYTTLLSGIQLENALRKKYLTLRLYSSGKVLISGFDEIAIQQGVQQFLEVCNQF